MTWPKNPPSPPKSMLKMDLTVVNSLEISSFAVEQAIEVQLTLVNIDCGGKGAVKTVRSFFP